MSHTFLIAECASTHDGELRLALDMIQMARDTGFDAVKFQYWSDADALADRRRVEPHYREIYRRYQVPRAWLDVLKGQCDASGIEFMCTTFLPADVPVLTPYLQRHKLSSFELMAMDMRAALVISGLPAVFSTGMASLADIDRSMLSRYTIPSGTPVASSDLMSPTLLHCTSSYPTPLNAANLGAIGHLRRTFPVFTVGLSDHTANTLTGAIAVGAGAQVIEVHVCHPKTDRANPDFPVSLTLGPFRSGTYVDLVRQAEVLMGSGVKEPHEVEAAMAAYRVTA